jgi:hypothetical protein
MPSDSQRDAAAPLSDGEGSSPSSKIDELLLVGLDHYFAGQYEQAINVWTRALFLDRGHARARAYIERARNAIAEQQREAEALLHQGVDALDRGDVGAARQLVKSAVERGGFPDEALAVLGRLERLEHASSTSSLRVDTGAREARSLGRAGAFQPRGWIVVAGIVLLAAAAVALARPRVNPLDVLLGEEPRAVVVPASEDPIPVPRASEITMARARSLFNRGHLHESLRELDTIAIDDPLKADADLMRAAIQRTLLTGGAPQTSLPSTIPTPAR